MYIFAVALEDGKWHHINSYSKKRSTRKSTVNLWHKIKTHEDKIWTKKYHHPNPKKRSFGAKIVLKMKDGTKIVESLEKANAHPYGLNPFKRENYIEKFLTLTDGIINVSESKRFLRDVQNLEKIKSGGLHKLNIEVNERKLKRNNILGIF